MSKSYAKFQHDRPSGSVAVSEKNMGVHHPPPPAWATVSNRKNGYPNEDSIDFEMDHTDKVGARSWKKGIIFEAARFPPREQEQSLLLATTRLLLVLSPWCEAKAWGGRAAPHLGRFSSFFTILLF